MKEQFKKVLTELGETCVSKPIQNIFGGKSAFLLWFKEVFVSQGVEHRYDENYAAKLGKRTLGGLLDTLYEVSNQVNTNLYKVDHLSSVVAVLTPTYFDRVAFLATFGGFNRKEQVAAYIHFMSLDEPTYSVYGDWKQHYVYFKSKKFDADVCHKDSFKDVSKYKSGHWILGKRSALNK